MRWLLVGTIALFACRTQPLMPQGDATPAIDLALTVDLGAPPSDDMCIAACPVTCPTGAWCIPIARGDCSTWGCTLPQGKCVDTPTCACAGGDSVCSFFARDGETLSCVDQPQPNVCGPSVVVAFMCQSSTPCI